MRSHLLITLTLLTLALTGRAEPPEEERSTRDLLLIVRRDRDADAWTQAVQLLSARDDEAREQLGRALRKLERKYERALSRAAKEIDDLGGAKGEDEAFAAALAKWEAAMLAARDFIFDEQKFPPGTPQNWKSVGWGEAVRLGELAVAAFHDLEKRGARGLARATALTPEEALDLDREHRDAAANLLRVREAMGEPLDPPEVRELSRTVLLIAGGDFEAAKEWIRMRHPGEDRWRACYVFWQAFLSRNRPLEESLDGGTRRSLGELNTYRMALGHSPLLLNEKLMRAALGHSEEMARLGYFSHDSPIEERRTEGMRAALEGYRSSVSENIFKASSLPRSLLAWKQSAKHHRTMTLPQNVEAGIGVKGPCTMVFGTGERDTPPHVEY